MSSIKEFSPSKTKNIKNHRSSSPISHRTQSFSSFSSSFSSNSSLDEFSLQNSPSTSFNHISSSGIPFSWETIPGIPKKQVLTKMDSRRKQNTTKYLPMPPPMCTSKKHYITKRDPFYTALVECSKGDNEDDDEEKDVFSGGNIAKSLSTRLGLVNMSCKNTSNVIVESLVFLPKVRPRRISYDVLKKR